MKIVKLILAIVFIGLIMKCSIGTQRDACRNNLNDSFVARHCKDLSPFILIGIAGSPNNDPDSFQRKEQVIGLELLNCVDYYERLRECDKEENKYIPSIYSKE
ncbi:hypothetical protein [Leptospira santarosai]|nr:hypothetical protein [Leptospira santarosai]MDI7237948.1 hypothetical protein [Leptospira santarosai]